METSRLNKSGLAAGQTPGIPLELQNSADKILAYAGVSPEKSIWFKSNLEIFIRMKDKSFSDVSSRQIREQLSTTFFDVYTSVFKKVQAEDNPGRLYLMFLYFGYMDERLLTPEQTNMLFRLAEQCAGYEAGSVYTLKSWLQEIYNRTHEPSVNEFGQDYQDVFMEKKRRHELTDKDKPAYDADLDGRLNHEINNLFQLGQRLCYGKISGYLPILHRDMISRDMEAALVTPDRIEASLNKILAVDFSAFHREIVFPHTNVQLAPELIMKPVWPDFILIPCFGNRAVVWQVVSGKSNTPGRFALPIFSDRNLDDMMVDIVAKFRWDLSKSMSRFTINKAHEFSLYADYCDYIQFYAKNRDLSAEAKEKLKTIIKRNRNNPAEVFTSDYHTWINYEANGLQRLNKVARDILFKHCPFSRSVRENLTNSPHYNALISQFDRDRARQCKILEARYAKLKKLGNIDPDLMENLAYYKS